MKKIESQWNKLEKETPIARSNAPNMPIPMNSNTPVGITNDNNNQVEIKNENIEIDLQNHLPAHENDLQNQINAEIQNQNQIQTPGISPHNMMPQPSPFNSIEHQNLPERQFTKPTTLDPETGDWIQPDINNNTIDPNAKPFPMVDPNQQHGMPPGPNQHQSMPQVPNQQQGMPQGLSQQQVMPQGPNQQQ